MFWDDALLWDDLLVWDDNLGQVSHAPTPVYGPITKMDIALYLANLYIPPRKKGRRLTLKELLLISQRDDKIRRQQEGS